MYVGTHPFVRALDNALSFKSRAWGARAAKFGLIYIRSLGRGAALLFNAAALNLHSFAHNGFSASCS
jgi:hypothetical protein